MSLYTTELRFICENYAGYDESQDYPEIDNIVENARRRIFGNYPIFDEEYRGVLEKKILKHYYTMEISEETVALWKLRLNNKMNEIMPYYNQLYKSELLEFDPLRDFDFNIEHKGNEQKNKSETNEHKTTIERNENETISNSEQKNEIEKNGNTRNKTNSIAENTNTENQGSTNENANTNSSETEKNRRITNTGKTDKYSDTPQGGLNGMESIEDDLYLTNARIINDNGTDNEDNERNNNSASSREAYAKTTENKEKSKNENETISNKETKEKSEDYSKQKSGTKTEKNDETGNRNSNSQLNSTNDYIEHKYGKFYNKSYSTLLEEFRKTFLNIDLMIIEELASLFFGLWG